MIDTYAVFFESGFGGCEKDIAIAKCWPSGLKLTAYPIPLGTSKVSATAPVNALSNHVQGSPPRVPIAKSWPSGLISTSLSSRLGT
jgi:hypothetical protein